MAPRSEQEAATSSFDIQTEQKKRAVNSAGGSTEGSTGGSIMEDSPIGLHSRSLMAGALPPAPWTSASATRLGIPSFCLVDADDADDERIPMKFNPLWNKKLRRCASEQRPELPIPDMTELEDRQTCLERRAANILTSLSKNPSPSSALAYAILVSLRSVHASMEEECALLLASLKQSDKSPVYGDTSVTPFLVLLSQRKASFYLNTLQRLVDENPIDGSLDQRLSNLYNHLSQLRQTSLAQDPLGIILSSAWAHPNLVFSLTVSEPLQWSSEGNDSTALDVEVRAVVDVSSWEMSQHGDRQLQRMTDAACKLKVKKCERTPLDSAVHRVDVTGNLVLEVLAAPPSSVSLSSVRILEARIHHLNSVPPRPVSTVDLFTSKENGSDNLKVGIRVQTRKTVNGDRPKLRIELVVDTFRE